MTDTVRLWLVERTYTDRDLVVLIYATPDGSRQLRKELASTMLARTTVTAAVDVDPERLDTVDDVETRERYAMETERLRADYDPEDPV